MNFFLNGLLTASLFLTSNSLAAQSYQFKDSDAMKQNNNQINTPLIKAMDHIVLTVNDIDATTKFYQRTLGMKVISFGAENHRKALLFGSTKINLHQKGKEFEPKASHPTAGSADMCFIVYIPIKMFIERLNALHIRIEEGPVERTGALGRIISVYFRDPDGNLIEVSNYLK